jgi:murein DD-endopeptidase MepM/ murein hydrolase activator NlpD
MACAALPIAPVGTVTSGYGWRNRPSGPDLHTGIDLGAPLGTPVYAMLPGQVVVSAPNGELSGYGETVVVQHGPTLFALYAHLSRRAVVRGAVVAPGQELGAVGTTAGTRDDPAGHFKSSGPHLHLEFLTRWPPSGRDKDRLNVGQVLGGFGVIVPGQGPLMRACGGAAPSSTAQPMVARVSSGFGALVALLALSALFGMGTGR